MEVLTIEHSAFLQLISKIDVMDDYIRKAKLEQQSSAGKITYGTIGNKYYYQIAEIKRCLRAHTIKSSEEMRTNL